MPFRMHRGRFGVVLLLAIALLLPLQSTASHLGIAGEQDNAGETITDVAKEGCLCHNPDQSHTVTILANDVPYFWTAGSTYTFHVQVIGGPSSGGSYTAGFSMLVSAGELSGGEGYESKTQNYDDDVLTLTHTATGANEGDRSWLISWTAPEEGAGNVLFWITGNSVSGDGLPGADDMWNQLTFSLREAGDEEEDDGRLRMLFAGDGNVVPPEVEGHEIDLHHMGAPFRAHWLGLLGFNAVIMVIIFCGIMLRYGFSTSYKGRSNLLKLRYKKMRRGDQ